MWIKNQITPEELIESAMEARKKAYAPYSGFKVGAALLTTTGQIYQGCNIENASFGVTNCAERTALFKAVSEGERHFSAIAVVGGKNNIPEGYSYPCGICRQALREFCDPMSMKVIVARSREQYETYTLSALLPGSFGPDNLKPQK